MTPVQITLSLHNQVLKVHVPVPRVVQFCVFHRGYSSTSKSSENPFADPELSNVKVKEPKTEKSQSRALSAELKTSIQKRQTDDFVHTHTHARTHAQKNTPKQQQQQTNKQRNKQNKTKT